MREFFQNNAIAIVIAIILVIKAIFYDVPRRRQAIRETSYEYSRQKWYVKGISIFGSRNVRALGPGGWEEDTPEKMFHKEGVCVVYLASAEMCREQLRLRLCPGHPSVETLKTLGYHDIIALEFAEEPLDKSWDPEISSHVLIRPCSH